MPPCATDPAPGVLLARGVVRGLGDLGLAALTEFTTPDGLRMDVCALAPGGEIWCIEVKSSRTDFVSDAKWPGYAPWCDRFCFAVPETFPQTLLPEAAGVICADPWGAELIRAAPLHPLAPARRRALTLRFARVAADRLARLVP